MGDVEEFLYMFLARRAGGATKDLQQRLSNARQTFYRLPKNMGH